MSERVSRQTANPMAILKILETRTRVQLESRTFRRFYSIPTGEGVDLTKEVELPVGADRIWRETGNANGLMGRLILPGEFSGFEPDYAEYSEEQEVNAQSAHIM